MIDYTEALKTLFIVILRRQFLPKENEIQAHLKGLEKTPSGIVKKVAEFYISKERKGKTLERGVSKSLLKVVSPVPGSFINSVMASVHLKQDQQQWLALLEAEISYSLTNFNDFLIKYDKLPSSKKYFLERSYDAACDVVSRFSRGSIVPVCDDVKAEQVYSLESLEESRVSNGYYIIESQEDSVTEKNLWYKGKVKISISVLSNVEVGKAYEVTLSYNSVSFKGVCNLQQARNWWHITERSENPVFCQVKVLPVGKLNSPEECDFKVSVLAVNGGGEQIEKDSYMLISEDGRPDFVFVHLAPDLKQRDTLYPIYSALKEMGYKCHLKSITPKNIEIDVPDPLFFISAPEVYKHLKNKYPEQKYVFLEHGAAPVKRYSYRPHYCAYDLLLLPGVLWKERLLRLYSDVLDEHRVHVVGYSKVKSGNIIDHDNRVEWCKKYSLDPSRPVILFAPTWSGGDDNAGIFNYRYFENISNVVVFPHDADKKFVKEALGDNVEKVIEFSREENKSISDVYPYVDILVSDISSTAVEFSALGGKSVCILPEVIKDFDYSCIEGDAIKIAHTDSYWDFCPVVKPEDLKSTLEKVMKGEAEHLYDYNKVKCILDCVGDDSVKKVIDKVLNFAGLSKP